MTFKIYRLRDDIDPERRLLAMAPEDAEVPGAKEVVHTFSAVTREHATIRFKDFSAGWDARAQASS